VRRPNLAAKPFLDVRPVWLTGAVLATMALVLTGLSLAEFVRARGRELAAADVLRRTQARRAELAAQVEAGNRELAAVSWKKLQLETSSLQVVVGRRKLVWSQLLADLERVTPWNVRLVSINPTVDKDGRVHLELQGLATDRAGWLKMLAVLFTDSNFSEPLPKSEEAPSPTNGKGYRFLLSVRYWPEGRP